MSHIKTAYVLGQRQAIQDFQTKYAMAPIDPQLAATLIGAGVGGLGGAGIGAAAAGEDHRGKGALIGGLSGAGLGAGLGYGAEELLSRHGYGLGNYIQGPDLGGADVIGGGASPVFTVRGYAPGIEQADVDLMDSLEGISEPLASGMRRIYRPGR